MALKEVTQNMNTRGVLDMNQMFYLIDNVPEARDIIMNDLRCEYDWDADFYVRNGAPDYELGTKFARVYKLREKRDDTPLIERAIRGASIEDWLLWLWAVNMLLMTAMMTGDSILVAGLISTLVTMLFGRFTARKFVDDINKEIKKIGDSENAKI